MGCFSWKFADTNNKERLRCGKPAYVPCPNGEIFYESCYGGYGIFDGRDIYELVADWNQDSISVAQLEKPKAECYKIGNDDGKEYFEKAMERYEYCCRRMTDFVKKQSSQYMIEHYGKEWKREIGIDIACYDKDNESLKFPIKICKSKPKSYYDLVASKSDPMQGWD